MIRLYSVETQVDYFCLQPIWCKESAAYLKVMRLGLEPTGGVWLQTMWATGRRTGSPAGASSLLRPITSSIQAPPRFSAGLL